MTKELVPLVCALLFAACAPLPSPAPPAARDARHGPAPGVARPAPFPTERERAALFAELVGVTRRYHAFSELTQQNLNLRWHDELPALADAFRRASDEAELRDALSRFVASLHDAHLSYAPPASAGRGERLTLGVTLETEWVEGRPRFYVAALTEDVARRAPGLRRGDLVVAAFRARVDNVDDGWYRWFQRATAGLAPGAELQRPFKCVNAACSGDNRFSPAHGLIAAPVALLVGPACASSCAHVAHIFDENDFGPLIGEPTAASYTAQRLTYPVKTAAGLDLGAIRLGLSRDRSGKTGLPVEGYAVHLDRPVERSFDEPARWDSALVDAALSAFRTYPFPKRTAPLGP